MFAKLYSYLWGEQDTEAIVTKDTIPECMEVSFIEKIENIPSANQTDEELPVDEESMEAECIPDCDETEVESGWVHIKDYKVVALSDNESCISIPTAQEKKKNDDNLSEINVIEGEVAIPKTKKTKLANRRKEIKKREMQCSSHAARLDIPLLPAVLYQNQDQYLEQQNNGRRMTRRAMKMSNSTALVNSSSNKPSRRRFYYTPNGFSGAVNNRKC